MAIQTRRGNKANFEPDRLQPGEIATPLDTDEVYIRTGSGVFPLLTGDGGGNRGVRASEKGKAGGVLELPPTLPTAPTLYMLNPDGTVSPASATATLLPGTMHDEGAGDSAPMVTKIGNLGFLTGVIRSDTNAANGDVLAHLPEGFWPAKDNPIVIITASSTQGRIDIKPNGDIVFAWGGNLNWFPLGGIHYNLN